ncbi:MAG: TatD family hydrolase [Eubacteriaceae bacterium]
MLIDTHAHLDDEKYKETFSDLISELIEKEMKIIINPGVDIESSYRSVEIATEFDIIYAAIGIHPHEAIKIEEQDFNKLKKLAINKKVVAIGEIGLDYYYEYSPKEIQKDVFVKQINIAKSLDLPIIVHSRDAHNDTYEIIKKHSKDLKGVLHSFSGSWEMAKKYIDLGFYISFSGPITFKNSRKLPEVAKNTPLDRILIETDSPYLTPVPYRGKVNNPIYVSYVASKICELKEIEFDYFMQRIKENTLTLFNKIAKSN